MTLIKIAKMFYLYQDESSISHFKHLYKCINVRLILVSHLKEILLLSYSVKNLVWVW